MKIRHDRIAPLLTLAVLATTIGCFEVGVETRVCGFGFERVGAACVDIDECATGADLCATHARCTNSDGSYDCVCDAGWVGDGTSCADADECLAGTDDCADNATCINTIGSFACACAAGFEGDGYTCVDIDECADDSAACHPEAHCDNTAGGYDCHCGVGYNGDGFECEPECGDLFCAGDENLTTCPSDCDLDLTVIVAGNLTDALAQSLQIYRADLLAAGQQARVVTFVGGDVKALKVVIADEVASYGIDGVFLVGDLPAAWYEMTADYGWGPELEEFPTDIYLMDHQAVWRDDNQNGLFESHTALDATVFTARLSGSASELESYFAKVHRYRTEGSLVEASAFIFIDDDWAYWPGDYGLGSIYSDVELLYDLAESTRDSYLDRMTGAGAEFVYQWIHSYATELYFMEGGDYSSLYVDEIAELNLKGSFYNLFDCSAARFTEENLATTYLLQTEFGLATIGSTKPGGVYNPETFHGGLAAGETWGESYRRWYNDSGVWDDSWWLGIVIVGDPMLTVSGDVGGMLKSLTHRQWSAAERTALWKTMGRFAAGQEVDGYADYRAAHPEHF